MTFIILAMFWANQSRVEYPQRFATRDDCERAISFALEEREPRGATFVCVKQEDVR